MEYFYREMRREHTILMDEDQPVGGQWNYDSENRKPPKTGLDIPETYTAKPDAITQEVLELVGEMFADHFGDLEPFHFAVTADQARSALKQFVDERLVNFGDYQDAMLQGEPWMYHSHIGFYLNCGLLTPRESIEAAETAYREKQAPLNAVEGFIRQILGWREYVRGLYWLKMPEYAEMNYLEAKRSLPDFFWTAKTEMNCLHQCVQETKENAYAHHIQRLMIIGNFALIAGLNPEEVNEWYWIVYADAYQWVELPNVSGMVLFADGGLLASKPYAASGAYINRMSNYCKGCRYSVSKKNGPDACPFNYLYWNFLIQHKERLKKNPRMAMIYRTLEKMSLDRVDEIREDSQAFLSTLN
jgi:deoxyribodipyrimidine photolyase-related protein